MAAEIRILATNGKLYKIDTWDKSKTAKGIAVFDLEQNHQFVIGLEIYNNCYICSGQHINKVDWTILDINDISLLNGYEETLKLLSNYTDDSTDYILTHCKNNNAYLGSTGEFKIIYDNLTQIKLAFEILGHSFTSIYQYTPYAASVDKDEDFGGEVELWEVVVSEYGFYYNTTGRFSHDFYLFYKYDGSLEENEYKPKTIAENLQILKDSTDAIKLAIIDKGGDVSGDISTWAGVISGINSGGTDEDYVFTGTRSYNGSTVTITGDLNKVPDNGRNYLLALGCLPTGPCYDSYFISNINGPYTLIVDFVEPVMGDEIPAICILNIVGFTHTVIPVTFKKNHLSTDPA